MSRRIRLFALVGVLLLVVEVVGGCGFLEGRNWTVAVAPGKTMVTTHRVESALIVNIAWPVLCQQKVECVIDFLAGHTPEDPMRTLLELTSTRREVRDMLQYTLFDLNRRGVVHAEQDPPSPCVGFESNVDGFFGWKPIEPRDDYGCLYRWPIDIS